MGMHMHTLSCTAGRLLLVPPHARVEHTLTYTRGPCTHKPTLLLMRAHGLTHGHADTQLDELCNSWFSVIDMNLNQLTFENVACALRKIHSKRFEGNPSVDQRYLEKMSDISARLELLLCDTRQIQVLCFCNLACCSFTVEKENLISCCRMI